MLLPLEVILDQAILRVPHEESLTRIYEFSEIWGEAVEQVGFLTGPVGRRMWLERRERGSGSELSHIYVSLIPSPPHPGLMRSPHPDALSPS